MEKLFEIQKITIEQFLREPFYNRQVFNQITLDNKITGIVGSRGSGSSRDRAMLLLADARCSVKRKL